MKRSVLSITCLLAIALITGCQNQMDQESVNKPIRKSSARRACGSTNFKFLYPDTGYGYSATGCVLYNITGGQTRQFKVMLNNYIGFSDSKKLRIRHSNQSSIFEYFVTAVTGGSVSTVPYDSNSIDEIWTVPNMPAYSTYELTLSVTVPIGAVAGENTVRLILEEPCGTLLDFDCTEDVNLNLLRTF